MTQIEKLIKDNYKKLKAGKPVSCWLNVLNGYSVKITIDKLPVKAETKTIEVDECEFIRETTFTEYKPE